MFVRVFVSLFWIDILVVLCVGALYWRCFSLYDQREELSCSGVQRGAFLYISTSADYI